MKKQRRAAMTMLGAAGAAVLVMLALAAGLSLTSRGQAQETPPLMSYPEFPPTPTMGPAPTTGPQLSSTNALLADTFTSDQSLSNWEFVDLEQVLPESRSNWAVRDGRLIQDRTGRIKGASIQETLAVTGRPDWGDYTVSAKFYDDGNGTVGLVARRQGNNYYRYRMLASSYEDTPKYVLEKVVDGVATPLATVDGPGYEKYTWYTLSMTVSGSTIQVRLDGKLVAEATDATLKSGQAGLYTRAMGDIQFEDVVVAAL